MIAPSTQTLSQIPRASGTIHRPRLIEKLQGVLEHKLTLISAPPGYGKTTLVAQFARQTTIPIAWHTVEERERDVPNLYAESLAALSFILPDIQSLTTTQGLSSGELAAQITNYLREELTGDIIYVLDDVQNLAGSPAAETWLRTLVTLLPATCHLVILSRILPDLPLTEMIARREVLAIGQQELQFTPQEIHRLSNEVLGVSQSAAEVQEIAARLEGWPAGVILALHPLPPDLELGMLSGGKGPEALFDALANLMLSAQPERLRDFLLASSTLSRMTPELCAVALQLPDSGYWLEEAQHRSLFVARVSGGLVYHALFRSFLQRQLKSFDPDYYADLHARAAVWFEANNQVDEAFDHYLSADLPERAADISERVAQSYFTQGKTETLLTWGAKLIQVGVEVPRLLLTCAMIHTDRYDFESAEAELNIAEVGFRERSDDGGLTSVKIQRAMTSLLRGQYGDAAAQGRQLLESRHLSGNYRARTLNILGLAELWLGNAESSVRNLEEALPLYRADGDVYALSQSLQNLELAYTRLGRLDDAGACLQEVVALRRSLKSATALALALNNLGYYYHQRSDYRQALVIFQEGLSVAARVPDRRAESYLYWSLGDLQRDQGTFDEALRLYNYALQLLGASEPSLRSAILISASVLRRWQGRYHEAISYAEEAYAVANMHHVALERAFALAMVWAARAHLGEFDEALRQLEEVEADLRRQGALFELLRIFGIGAHINLMAGNPSPARQYIQSAFQLALRAGSSQPLASEIIHTPVLKSFVTTNFNDNIAIAHELRCLQEAQTRESYQLQIVSGAVNATTYSLRVLTLGQEGIERDGKPVSSSEWRATSAREMFLYLLFVGPHSREDFSLAFWPDSSPKQVRSNFHTTLYRARQALGENAVVFQDGKYMINPDIDLRSDAHEMKNLTAQARLMAHRDARTEDLWQRAVNLYRGDFLPTLDADWVYPLRESFRETYIEALIGLGECARIRRDFRHALSALKQALKVDPYREDVHRAIMTCYAQKGDKKKVLNHLNELQQMLWQELAVKPSSETLALARTLLN